MKTLLCDKIIIVILKRNTLCCCPAGEDCVMLFYTKIVQLSQVWTCSFNSCWDERNLDVVFYTTSMQLDIGNSKMGKWLIQIKWFSTLLILYQSLNQKIILDMKLQFIILDVQESPVWITEYSREKVSTHRSATFLFCQANHTSCSDFVAGKLKSAIKSACDQKTSYQGKKTFSSCI